MKLKSIIAATLVCASLSTSAFGSGLFHPTKEGHISINGGLNSTNSQSDTTTSFGVGYDGNFEKLMIGTNLYIDIPTDATATQYFSAELSIGYRSNPKTSLYGLLSYEVSNDSVSMSGVGFGAGAKYQLMDYVAIDSRVKYTPMSGAFGLSYDKTTVMIGLEFNFRKADGAYQW